MLDTERILIVDDDQAATREVAGFLERQGYPVLVARTGRDGLRTVRETPVSLVLLARVYRVTAAKARSGERNS